MRFNCIIQLDSGKTDKGIVPSHDLISQWLVLFSYPKYQMAAQLLKDLIHSHPV
jgi:hypothetical protein